MAQRIRLIDIARGIAIMLVVIGHSGAETHIVDGIYFFHMPLFFFISGLFLKPIHTWSDLFRGGKTLRIKHLYVPFVIYMLFFLTLSPLLFRLGMSRAFVSSFTDWLHDAIVIMRFRVGCVDILGHYWFLPVLFGTHLLSIVLVMKICSKIKIVLLALCLFLAGYTLSQIYGINAPYDFSRIMYYVGFYLAGFLCAKYVQQINRMHDKWLWCICVVSFAIIALLTMNSPVIFTSPLLFLFAALMGIAMIFAISALLSHTLFSNVLSYIGQHTMPIFTWHVLVFKTVEFILAEFGVVEMTQGWYGRYKPTEWWLLYTFCGMALPICVIYFKWRIGVEKCKS